MTRLAPWRASSSTMAMSIPAVTAGDDGDLPLDTHGTSSSGRHIPFLEFLRSRTERAELVHRRTRGREDERRKRFSDHLVEVIAGCDARADVRTEVLTRLLGN